MRVNVLELTGITHEQLAEIFNGIKNNFGTQQIVFNSEYGENIFEVKLKLNYAIERKVEIYFSILPKKVLGINLAYDPSNVIASLHDPKAVNSIPLDALSFSGLSFSGGYASQLAKISRDHFYSKKSMDINFGVSFELNGWHIYSRAIDFGKLYLRGNKDPDQILQELLRREYAQLNKMLRFSVEIVEQQYTKFKSLATNEEYYDEMVEVSYENFNKLCANSDLS